MACMNSVIPLQQAVYWEIAHFVGWKSREAGKDPGTWQGDRRSIGSEVHNI